MEFYFQEGLAPSTRRAYGSAKNRYTNFCHKYNLVPLPVSENQLCQYVGYLAEHDIAHSTMKVYLSAIRHMQIAYKLPEPNISSMARLEQVLKGIKRNQAKQNKKSPTRLPITSDLMRKMRTILEEKRDDEDHIMVWAAMCLCFFGFLRSGEMTIPTESAFDPGAHLTYSDVAVDDISNPSSLKVRIKVSKTDPFRKGVDIYLGRTHSDLCPVEAMLAFLAIRGNKPGFLFQFKDGKNLTKDCFVKKVWKLLQQVGVDSSKYAGHSFRIGVAEATIKMLGRWESSAYLLYIKTPRDKHISSDE